MVLGGYGENFLPLDSPTTNKLSEKKKKSKNLSRKRKNRFQLSARIKTFIGSHLNR
jgi:hypothetical protein